MQWSVFAPPNACHSYFLKLGNQSPAFHQEINYLRKKGPPFSR
jgi:hypothetical protein